MQPLLVSSGNNLSAYIAALQTSACSSADCTFCYALLRNFCPKQYGGGLIIAAITWCSHAFEVTKVKE